MAYSRTEHIAAGHFKTGQDEKLSYQAYLGTCLGVALYDRVTKIGGMIHILLPEPPGFSGADFPEKYASTGIPLLIGDLIRLGASPENLEATIAGGALVGPVSQQDIHLDIGGRSAEIAASLLSAVHIKVVRSETGGFFTCTLELDMATGETRIKPAWIGGDKPEMAFLPPTITDIFNTIDQLKPIPQTALKLFRMFQSSRHNIEEITQELTKDQVLAGLTLKLCNSALFAGMIKIDTLKDAVLLMGEDMLIKSIITAAVHNYYRQTGVSGYSLCKGGLFFHAVGVGATAEKIAEKSNRVSPKSAYTAGLLHDIGKVVLDQYISDAAPLFFRKMGQQNRDLVTTEKKIFGITHSEAGALLAKKWNFSDGLCTVIQWHHAPEKTSQDSDLTYTVYLADLLMEKFNAGFDMEKMQTQSFEPALKHLGLTLTDLPDLVDAIPINTFSPDEISERNT